LKRHKESNEALRISWRPAELANDNVGHGFCIYAGPGRQNQHLAAFVEGFGWRRGDTTAVIRFHSRSLPADELEFAALKVALEERLRTGDISPGEIVPGYWGIANA
jgi:hypothetical protein